MNRVRPELIGMPPDLVRAGSDATVCVLGPLRLHGQSGPVAVSGTLPKGFLAVLASEVGRPVALDRLTELLWGSAGPSGVRSALQQLATRARRSLAEVGLGDALRAEPPGYVLDLDPRAVDLVRFRISMRAAFEAARNDDHEAAVGHADRALLLWSDRAFADLVDLPLATYLGPFIDDERWRTEELRAVSLMHLGEPHEAARLLAVAIGAEPLRERLWVLEIEALVASGQAAEATVRARTAIDMLRSELGVGPGPALSALVDTLQPHPSRRHSRPARVEPSGAQRGMLDEALRRALSGAEQAARTAMAAGAHGEAAYQWQRALDLIDSGNVGDDDRLRALLGLADALNHDGREPEARAACLEAAELARQRSDGAGLAWAALGYCHDYIMFSPPPDQEALLREALTALGDGQHMLRSRLLARLAREIYWAESPDACRTIAEQAFAVARLAGDAETRLLARYSLAFGNWQPARTRELADVCEAYLADAISCGDRFHELLARRWLVPVVSELGEVARGCTEASAAIRLSDDLGISVQQWITRVIAGSHQLLVGDLQRAEQLAEEGLALGAAAEPANAIDFVSMLIWTIRWLQGRLDEIAPLVEEVASTPGLELPRRLGVAVTYAQLGRTAEATAILDDVGADEVDTLHHDASWYVALAAMAEAAAAVDHRGAAAIVLSRLKGYRDRIAITSTTATGPVAHHVGLCEWVVGDVEQAMQSLLDSVAIADRCGIPVFGARSRVALAERLLILERPTEARDLARLARSEAERLGLRVAADVAQKVLDRAG